MEQPESKIINGIVKIKNPKTNRYIFYGTPLYSKLVREGVIQAYKPPKLNNFNQEETPQPQPPQSNRESQSLKTLVTNECVDTITKNKNRFSQNLTQEETDELLKRMLFEKLCISKKNLPTTCTKSKKSKTKKKKKRRFKVKHNKVSPPSSSSESSDLDSSDSDSD